MCIRDRRWIRGEVLRAEEGVGIAAALVGFEVPPVFSIDEQQIDAEGRWRLFEDIAERHEQPNARRAVVGAKDGTRAVTEIVVVVGFGARIPMRDVEYALRRRRIE